MPRRKRTDYPGAWWHVMNRAVAGACLFRNSKEGRFFLSLVARAVRKGWIQVHAYCLMPNHFHLLVRSPNGELSKAMHWIEWHFARQFNLVDDRPGALFQGRYEAKLIHCLRYRRAVFVYIHRNPRDAGLADATQTYTETSARFHASERGRPWLARSFGCRVREGRDELPPELIERWFADPAQDLLAADLLLRGSPSTIQRWLMRSVSSSSGLSTPRSLILPATLHKVLRRYRREEGKAEVWVAGHRHDVWSLLEAGLLRIGCAFSIEEVAKITEVSASTAGRRLRRHQTALREDATCAMLTARVLWACLRQDYGVARK